MASFPIVVSEFNKNSREVVPATLDQYHGRPMLSVRVWYYDGANLKPGCASIHDGVCSLACLRGKPAARGGARKGRGAA